MISKELLEILVCPETKESVSLADGSLIENLNAQIEEGKLENKGGQSIKEKIEGGLIRQDKKILYPIREGIPIMLIEEGIALPGA